MCCVFLLLVFVFVLYYLFKLREEIYEKSTKIHVHPLNRKSPKSNYIKIRQFFSSQSLLFGPGLHI